VIKRIENLDMCTELEELEFYDNQLTLIENLENLKCLTMLDLSYNLIKKIENINIPSLKTLFLVENKFKKVYLLNRSKI
jgi:protein phosphatase 1 regulatory subunit 7